MHVLLKLHVYLHFVPESFLDELMYAIKANLLRIDEHALLRGGEHKTSVLSGNRSTNQPTYQPTDRPTKQQTDMRSQREVILPLTG